jgi:ketosteroid isomerase-like protein
MRGSLPVIKLLLDHGADANIHGTGYDATPAGWAEHHGQPEAHQLLEALEQPEPAAPLTEERAGPSTQTGAAMRSVTTAFTAVSEGRFDGLGSMLAAEIDWQGLPDEDGQIPAAVGATKRSNGRIGLLANREVSVSSFLEAGDRVLAHAHRVADGELGPPERFLVAEVHDGQITNLRGYATEPEAHDALHAGSPPDPSPESDQLMAPREPHAKSESR